MQKMKTDFYSIGERLKHEDNLSNETFHPGTDRPSNGTDTVVGRGKKTGIREKERILRNCEMLLLHIKEP